MSLFRTAKKKKKTLLGWWENLGNSCANDFEQADWRQMLEYLEPH